MQQTQLLDQLATRRKPADGFSLMELSIVLAIIALLSTSVVVGISVMNNAAYRKGITQISQIQMAVQDFATKYGCYPGDCADPTVINGYTYTGDGNGYLATTWNGDENKGFWQHLSASGLLRDTLVPHTALSGLNAPRAALNSGAIINAYGSLTYAQNVLEFGMTDVTGALLTKEIDFIDRKIDDGAAGSGNIRSTGYGTGATTIYTGSGGVPCFPLATSCNSGSTQCITSGAYDLSLTGASGQCNMIYLLGSN